MANNKNLHLIVTGHWFDMHVSGGKDIEYRDLTPFWASRLVDKDGKYKEFDTVTLQLGYATDARRVVKEFKGITIEEPVELWAPCSAWESKLYNIHCGKIISCT